MPSMQDVIDFLLDLIRDEQLQAEFERDPEGVLEERGLEGVTAQDVRDARLQLADQGGAEPVGDDPPPGGNDPIAELRFTADNFEPGPDAGPPDAGPDLFAGPTIENTTIFNVDDRDTTVTISDNDTTVTQTTTTTDVTVIQDSFNDESVNDITAIQDNSTTIGVIESGPLDPDAGPAVNPPPAAGVDGSGVETSAPEEEPPAEPVDDPADADEIAAEPVEEGDPDPTLDAAVI
jgi:hypothetical protein